MLAVIAGVTLLLGWGLHALADEMSRHGWTLRAWYHGPFTNWWKSGWSEE
jgi:hypothetical protein